ncbi:tRNA lysidine(34) synthetase TilS [Glaciecola sp. KUL10]|uniref:tRNA lysidine(34) synthetase TilS n=1 Tax=Glaciecola sp. (strain KUL10) TaxID=2161813 RepID=UPI000D78879D|nr:tRNA lysidine(34) synthetase TilS [Glaciecola sp. KUL10]GBL04119.1 tRNA(Ile)-lysidine synthase [Glaciecola sp. KUL10]
MSKHDALLKILAQSIDDNVRHICVAYSGGIDSSVLLDLCHRYISDTSSSEAIKLSALHINHGISKHADAWQTHCQQVCNTLNIDFYSVSVQVKAKARNSLEALARDARYQAINDWADKHFASLKEKGIVLLGQHQDDQAETFLLQLKRGSGVKGLASMPAQFTSPQGHWFARPLLSVSQALINDYAQSYELAYIEDDSNKDVRFDRNFLRKDVLPIINKRWPSFSKTVSRTALLCQQQSQLVEVFARQTLYGFSQEAQSAAILSRYEHALLEIDKLLSIDVLLQSEVLRVWLGDNQVFPSFAQLNEALSLCHAAEDAQPEVIVSNRRLKRFDGYLVIVTKTEKPLLGQTIEHLPFEYRHSLFGFSVKLGKLDSDQLEQANKSSYQLEYASLSAKIKVQANRPSKSIKQWCKEYKVPPWYRATLPMVIRESEIKAIVLADRVLNVVGSELCVEKT